jgi:hypothetical protein
MLVFSKQYFGFRDSTYSKKVPDYLLVPSDYSMPFLFFEVISIFEEMCFSKQEIQMSYLKFIKAEELRG